MNESGKTRDVPRVAVCVATYKRPQMLAHLIESLNELSFDTSPPELRIIIIDNDSAESARSVCEQWQPRLRWPLEYYVETRRGISFARNRALAKAGESVDFIVFIDDDEVPESQWLNELLRVQTAYTADVVAGPVLPHFPEDVPDWVVKGQHFDHDRHQTGERLKIASTGNVLVRRGVFEQIGVFDERLGLTGGEDRHLFMRASRAGFKMIWADEAVVWDWIPASRTNMKWILLRFYRMGTTRSFREIDLRTSVLVYPRLVFPGCGFMLAGLALMPLGILAGRHLLVRHLRYICYGAGILTGLMGGRYEEYQQTHGT